MIYLAKNKKGKLERIQVCYLRRGYSYLPKWGALNYNGTVEIVPFDHQTYDGVVNALMEEYHDITVSKRVVDKGSQHIICLDKQYDIFNNHGVPTGFSSPTRISFTESGYYHHGITQFPEYYDNIEVIHKDKLWVAKDIDTNLWVCILDNGNVVSQNHLREVCIHDAVRRLS